MVGENSMKKTLFPHQWKAIEMMEEREKKKHISKTSYSIESNLSIYADITGFGKTISILGLILRDRMEWDMSQDFIQSSISNIFGGGSIVKKKFRAYKRLNVTLIVVHTNILNQWENELKETSLRFRVVHTKKRVDQLKIENMDVILCNASTLGYLLQKFSENAWKRFVFDEPTHTRIPFTQSIIAGFTWLITATPELLLRSHNWNKFFNTSMEYNLYKHLIIKNEDQFVRDSFQLPPLYQKFYKTSQPVFQIIKNLLSPKIQEMILAENIVGAIHALGGNTTSDLYQLIEKDKKEQLEVLKQKALRFERIGDSLKFHKWKDKIQRIEKELVELKERIHEILYLASCPICLESKQNPILLTCCQHMFCGKCVLDWFHKNCSCPLCRKQITSKHLVYHCSQDFSVEERRKEEPMLPSKTTTILKILSEIIDPKMIIFSSFSESFDLIRETLKETPYKFGEIKGTTLQRQKTIEDFKKGDLHILFLNSYESGTGLNLEEATDLVLYHTMSDSLFTQIRGRAYRLGRKKPLTIHFL